MIFRVFVIIMSFVIFSNVVEATEENVVRNELNETSNAVIQEEVKEEVPTETKKNETMYVQERCNIRASYSVDSDRVGGLDVGTEVTVIAEYSNGWYKIKYDGGEAYIKGAILRSTPPQIEEPAEETEEEPQPQPEQPAEEEPQPAEPQPAESENDEEFDAEYAELINEIGVLPEVRT